MEPKFICTGNEMISLPCINEKDASILDFTMLHMGFKGLIDVRGELERPLLRPVVKIKNEKVELKNIKWDKTNFWIPTFKAIYNTLEIEGTILAPIEERGFSFQLKVKNLGDSSEKVTIGFEGTWSETYHSINEDKALKAPCFAYKSGWNNSLVFDMRIGVSIFAFAPMFSEELGIEYTQNENEISYVFDKEFEVNPYESKVLDSFWGIGIEEVAATTSAKEMYRWGFEKELEKTKNWLIKRYKNLSDNSLAEIFHHNLFFNYFYASGKTIDTEELVLVTSRSPRYYVSAAYWDRDSLLWSFPSILLVDHSYAREMLLYVFGRQRKNIGMHSRYIDGTLLEPGFELDELCAPIIALYNYVVETKDEEILNYECIKDGISLILARLKEKKHTEFSLYETFLQPTDDMHVYPYITYDNVLVWRLYKNLVKLYQNTWKKEVLQELEEEANATYDAIFKHCVKNYKGFDIFAWSVDLEGNWDVYDEPPGSLQLMPFYGFLESDNEIYKNTVEVIRSSEYPYSFYECPIAELGCPHAPHPWILSVANSLLCNRIENSKKILMQLKMDNGVACESVDEFTGESTTGDAFATCAGFLVYAIYQAFHE